jgi:hypothetical protein
LTRTDGVSLAPRQVEEPGPCLVQPRCPARVLRRDAAPGCATNIAERANALLRKLDYCYMPGWLRMGAYIQVAQAGDCSRYFVRKRRWERAASPRLACAEATRVGPSQAQLGQFVHTYLHRCAEQYWRGTKGSGAAPSSLIDPADGAIVETLHYYCIRNFTHAAIMPPSDARPVANASVAASASPREPRGRIRGLDGANVDEKPSNTFHPWDYDASFRGKVKVGGASSSGRTTV